MIALYIATHNKTGLKYFGKTEKWLTEEELQENYHGSGKYWKRHLKKYGNDVTMKLYGLYDSETVEEIAMQFSKDNDIVNSNEWANLKYENGLDGGEPSNKNVPWTDEQKEKIKGKVTAKNINTGEVVRISKEEFDSNEHFVGHTTGTTFKTGPRESTKGNKNPAAIKINIYNNDDELMYECHGNFDEICRENNLPGVTLRKVYGKRIHTGQRKTEFTGWYAIKIKD